MIEVIKKQFVLILLASNCIVGSELSAAEDKLLTILDEEIVREMAAFSKQEVPSYYIDYRVDDNQSLILRTSFGSLLSNDESHNRVLTAVVRVGDYEFDNTHDFPGNYSMAEQMEVYASTLPVEDNPEAIKQVLWRISDKAYKNASGTFSSFKNHENSRKKEGEQADFSKEDPVIYYEEPLQDGPEKVDKNLWIERLKEYTRLFEKDSLIFHCEASMNYITQRKYFVSTEGSRIVQNSGYCQIQFLVSMQHEKGTILPLQKSYTATHPSGLPDHETILADFSGMYEKLRTMRKAPLAEPYAGPAILSPAATGVFFHEIFGHRIEGHRLQSVDDGQTFKDKLGNEVLPEGFNVYSDPSLTRWENQDLIGAYKYDDQGIEGQKVLVVENGILKNFLMSRRPMEEFKQSNGHGRAQAGYSPVSRQSNLIIESTEALTAEELRKNLIKECKKQKKEYGYYFKEVIGGLTYTDRYNANVFNVNPTEVYRIYVDGRQDELVTGVELIGTPLTMFSNILAAGDEQDVFTGFCGAESGSIPVTTIAPAIFVRKIETQKTPEYESKLPLLPGPDNDETNK